MIRFLIKTDDWKEVDLLEDFAPALTLQIHDATSWEDRNASFSSRMKFAPTRRNEKVFEYCREATVSTQVNRQLFECRLLDDSTEILGKGSVFSLLGFNAGYYEGSAYSSVKNLYDKLEEIDFSDSDVLGEVMMPIPSSTIGGITTFPTSAFFPNYVADINQTITADSLCSSLLYDYAYPFIPLGYRTGGAIKMILDELGYTLDSTFTDNLVINTVDRIGTEGEVAFFKPSALAEIWSLKTTTSYRTTNYPITYYQDRLGNAVQFYVRIEGSDIDKVADVNIVFALYNKANDPATELYLETFTLSDFIVVVESTSGITYKEITVIAKDNGTTIVNGSAGNSFTPYEKLPQNNLMKADIYGRYTATALGGSDIDVALQVNDAYYNSGAVAGAGTTLNIAKNIGYSNAKELFQDYLKLYGLVIDVDEGSKVIKARMWHEIRDNKTSAIDWTSKIAEPIRKANTQFQIGDFAQTNLIEQTQGSKNDYNSSVHLSVTDNRLPLTKECLNIKFEANSRDLSKEYETNVCAYYNSDLEYEKFKYPQIYFYDNPSGDYQLTTTYAGEIARGYTQPFFTSSVENASFLKTKIKLTANDLLSLDFFTPVFLQQTGKYYYINKIENYISGKVCDIELIKI